MLDHYREALARGSDAPPPDSSLAREQLRRLIETAIAALPDALPTIAGLAAELRDLSGRLDALDAGDAEGLEVLVVHEEQRRLVRWQRPGLAECAQVDVVLQPERGTAELLAQRQRQLEEALQIADKLGERVYLPQLLLLEAMGGGFTSITRSAAELSIVCLAEKNG